VCHRDSCSYRSQAISTATEPEASRSSLSPSSLRASVLRWESRPQGGLSPGDARAGTLRDMHGERRIVLLRHAKSSYPHGVPDHDRPLAGKGRRNAQAVGAWFVAEGPRISVALCSDATRARHTWEIVRSELVKADQDAPTRVEPLLYGATPTEVLALVRDLPDDVSTAVVIGHEPTMSSTALWLAGDGSDPDALARISEKFPTGGIAVLRLTSCWAQLAPGTAVLETFSKPRA
jgi:phosphohistidine phosphatase